ncbi:phycobilisome rod-core linker polypeptide [Candidatus Cyanaurora vandensis]|uniref:phycobilisome rod-core linker polypeptide n=1 Tax=Candidatus Cyanaurora vandensis TaxID=2714958 RepID=UPI0025809F1E|nr:phycobilisome rod-core linker polypeptide [Candidatus Cyanaurora vandensis]
MVDRFNVTVEGLIGSQNVKKSCESYTIDYSGLQALLKVLKRGNGRITSIEKLDVDRTPNYSAVVTPMMVELQPFANEDELQGVIRAAYRQVVGNAYIMDAERLTSSESMLRNGSICVRDFVRAVAKSDLYKSRFFWPMSQNRFVELNFKHLLGRAPYTQAEVSEHVQIYANAGYEAEIDSYLDGLEYQQAFGPNIVPYNRGFLTQTGQVTANFTRSLKSFPGFAGSDIPGASSSKALFPVV